jgi:hypothetical protein
MNQVLIVAKDITTLLLPLFLVSCFFAMVMVIRLLFIINKTASAVKETTFMVNSVVNSSLSGVV